MSTADADVTPLHEMTIADITAEQATTPDPARLLLWLDMQLDAVTATTTTFGAESASALDRYMVAAEEAEVTADDLPDRVIAAVAAEITPDELGAPDSVTSDLVHRTMLATYRALISPHPAED